MGSDQQAKVHCGSSLQQLLLGAFLALALNSQPIAASAVQDTQGVRLALVRHDALAHGVVFGTCTWPNCPGGTLTCSDAAETFLCSLRVGYSPDQAGLLHIKNALPNFQTYKRRAQCYGWDETPGSQVCTWTGVQCTNGSVTGIHFTNNGSVLAGEGACTCAYGAPLACKLGCGSCH